MITLLFTFLSYFKLSAFNEKDQPLMIILCQIIINNNVLLQAIRLCLLRPGLHRPDAHQPVPLQDPQLPLLFHRNTHKTQVFLLQRLLIILFAPSRGSSNPFSKALLLKVAPYSFLVCTSNVLTSYCITVMPLAAYMALKKFVVLFVLLVGILMGLPNSFNRAHHCCIGAIVVGGLMIGGPDIFRGDFLGYIASLIYTFLEALTLQISTLLYQQHGV